LTLADIPCILGLLAQQWMKRAGTEPVYSSGIPALDPESDFVRGFIIEDAPNRNPDLPDGARLFCLP
jgi:hypothetical protein